MNDIVCNPTTCWISSNLVDSFIFFKQRCKFYFSVKNILADKQVDYILLFWEGSIRSLNSRTFTNKTNKNNPLVIWRKFEEWLELQVNFHIARFYLRLYTQRDAENINDLITRCWLQGNKWKYQNAIDTKEWLLEQVISRIKHTELQKQQVWHLINPWMLVESTKLQLATWSNCQDS